MKNSIWIVLLVSLVYSCKKKDDFNPTLEYTTKVSDENEASKTLQGLDAIENDTGISSLGSQDEVSAAKVKEFEPKEKRILKFTERYDAEGSEVIVISEKGKKDLWLYKTSEKSNVYELRKKGISVIKSDNTYIVNKNGTVTVYNKK